MTATVELSCTDTAGAGAVGIEIAGAGTAAGSGIGVGHPLPAPAVAQGGSSWEPTSPCTPCCLPDAGTLPRVGTVRVAARMAALSILVAAFALSAVVLPLFGAPRRARALRRIFRTVLRAIGVRMVHTGAERFDAGPDTGGVLVVANHLSWLDIMVLGAVQPVRMVAKQEVRNWPVLGAVATRAGTLFVDRARLRCLPSLVADTARALRGGAAVGLFPEGTTWCGAAMGEFRRAGFQAAVDAGVAVRPVAQRMRLLDGTPTSMGAFVGADTLLDSILRVLRLPGLVFEIEVLPLLPSTETDRRELAHAARRAVCAATGVSVATAVPPRAPSPVARNDQLPTAA
jgi:1-acyl-sn-glycerol-3-phosphate acyltransferase